MLIRFVQTILSRLAMMLPGGSTVRPCLQRWRGVKMGRGVWLSQQVYLDELYPEAITIGEDCAIAYRCSIFSHFHRGTRKESGGARPVVIENGVFIGPHCVVLPGVRIGEGSVIKAGSVITRNVPPHVFWGADSGRPLAEVTVPLTPGNTYEDFMRGLKPIRPRRDPES